MKLLASSLGGLLILSACSSHSSGPTTSTVKGTLLTSSFSQRPTAVQAVDEAGTSLTANLDVHAAFSVVLARHHTYRFFVQEASTQVPLVFPRASGVLDTTVRVSGGGAVVDLGQVRYLASTADDMPVLQSVSALSVGDPTTPTDQCVDGRLQSAGTPCAEDEAAESCSGGEEEDDDESEADDDANEVEDDCENGVNPATGAACTETEDDEAEDDTVAADAEMSVPQHNAPNDIGGCGDEDEDEDDDDGEHED